MLNVSCSSASFANEGREFSRSHLIKKYGKDLKWKVEVFFAPILSQDIGVVYSDSRSETHLFRSGAEVALLSGRLDCTQTKVKH